jgi:hypothetical protein
MRNRAPARNFLGAGYNVLVPKHVGSEKDNGSGNDDHSF